MRINVSITKGEETIQCRPTLTSGEIADLTYIGKSVDDSGLVKEHLREIAEEFVIVNFAEADEQGYVHMLEEDSWDLRRQVIPQLVGFVNEIRVARDVEPISIPAMEVLLYSLEADLKAARARFQNKMTPSFLK